MKVRNVPQLSSIPLKKNQLFSTIQALVRVQAQFMNRTWRVMNNKILYPEEIVEGCVNAESIREQGNQICTDVLNNRFLNA